MTQIQIKAPSSVFDVPLDWDDDSVLAADETISTSAWAVEPTGDMTTTSTSIDAVNKRTACFISAGSDRQTYRVTNTITTSAGRTHARTLIYRVAPVGV